MIDKKTRSDFRITSSAKILSLDDAKEYVEFIFWESTSIKNDGRLHCSKLGLVTSLAYILADKLNIGEEAATDTAISLFDAYNFNWGKHAYNRIIDTWARQGPSISSLRDDLRTSGFTQEDISSAKRILRSKNPNIYEKIKNVKFELL